METISKKTKKGAPTKEFVEASRQVLKELIDERMALSTREALDLSDVVRGVDGNTVTLTVDRQLGDLFLLFIFISNLEVAPSSTSEENSPVLSEINEPNAPLPGDEEKVAWEAFLDEESSNKKLEELGYVCGCVECGHPTSGSQLCGKTKCLSKTFFNE